MAISVTVKPTAFACSAAVLKRIFTQVFVFFLDFLKEDTIVVHCTDIAWRWEDMCTSTGPRAFTRTPAADEGK